MRPGSLIGRCRRRRDIDGRDELALETEAEPTRIAHRQAERESASRAEDLVELAVASIAAMPVAIDRERLQGGRSRLVERIRIGTL